MVKFEKLLSVLRRIGSLTIFIGHGASLSTFRSTRTPRYNNIIFAVHNFPCLLHTGRAQEHFFFIYILLYNNNNKKNKNLFALCKNGVVANVVRRHLRARRVRIFTSDRLRRRTAAGTAEFRLG